MTFLTMQLQLHNIFSWEYLYTQYLVENTEHPSIYVWKIYILINFNLLQIPIRWPITGQQEVVALFVEASPND